MSKLAVELNLNERVVLHYLEGREPVPDELLLRVIDVILKQLPEPPTN